ncbi:ATP-dependent zinc protease [Methylophaga sp. OBS1]|jgi:hypothetical protein|uniref:retropepsin-like aspartic peptidase RloA3 n=1 Tax=Methylophaga sp. OBS1 TaxID=2991933 RepID=UPI002251AC09|nr:ATP-dependent zinc protease [Methylophaga sp. OBS1]MCX4193878.1 ATP-dependent zinc protease [Methylophaga sp. OBS1]
MRNGLIRLLTTLSFLMLLHSTVSLAKEPLGWIEKVQVQPWGVEAKAKLDTGALTSSMHAEEIERFEKQGEQWVRFTIDFEDAETGDRVSQRIERPLLREFTAVGAGGRDQRSVVAMTICVGNTLYEEQFSLRDRDNMIYPILLGRRTIQHLGPVDVTRTFLTEAECDADSVLLSLNEGEGDPDIGVN